MKYLITLPACLFFTILVSGQQPIDNKKEIHAVISSFMHCLIKKDSTTFYGLFHKDPVVWIGVLNGRTREKFLATDSSMADYFPDNYKSFYRGISDKGLDEEKFDRIKIIEDGAIASATFDYSFWSDGKMKNWGSEHWGLIKTKGKWKISSVLFSMELTRFAEQPDLKEP